MAPVPRTAPHVVSKPPDTDYTKALDAAMENVGKAITAKLGAQEDHFRFQEVQRLAKIGEAIGRQKARESRSVRDFVDPARRNAFACGGPDGGLYAMGANYAGLGGAGDPNDPFAPDPLDGPQIARYGGIGRMNNPGAGDDGNPFGAMRGAFESMAESKQIETQSELQIDRLKELKNLRELLEADNLPEEERKVLEERKQAVIEALASANEREADKHKRKILPMTTPQMAIRCVNPECGNAHDHDWVDAEGRPRLCDICGRPMLWAPGAPPPEEVVLVQGQSHSCGVVVPDDAPPDEAQPFMEIHVHREEGQAVEILIDVVGAFPIVEHHGGMPCYVNYRDGNQGDEARDLYPNGRAIFGDEDLLPVGIEVMVSGAELLLRLMNEHLDHVTVFIENRSDLPVRVVKRDGPGPLGPGLPVAGALLPQPLAEIVVPPEQPPEGHNAQ